MRFALVIGAGGQVGTELGRLEWPEGWSPIPLTRADLDLADLDGIAAHIEQGYQGQPWATVINCAAYTAVDRAETDAVTAWQINALAPAAMASACHALGIPLVHVSTDYVFSGEKIGAWDVFDPTQPLGVYGASKLGGELAVATCMARYAIVRTAWVVSAHGSNFVKTMMRLAGEREIVRVVNDQRGSPTTAKDLSIALQSIAIRLVEDADAPTGTFHFSNRGAVSWAGFAQEIFRQSRSRGGASAAVHEISTEDYPTPARRPRNSVLNNAAIEHAYGLHARPWKDAVGEILDELLGVSQ